MRNILDVEKSSELGKFFCKSKLFFEIHEVLVILMSFYVGLYVNLCVETKKWMDVKDAGGELEKVARKKLLAFYDALANYDDFDEVTKEAFCALDDRVKTVKRMKKKKKTDQSSMKNKFKSLGPPPEKSTSPSTDAG